MCVCLLLTGYTLYQSLLHLVILQLRSKEFGDLTAARKPTFTARLSSNHRTCWQVGKQWKEPIRALQRGKIFSTRNGALGSRVK